ncbi:MAG: zinc ribbon domain-containing protein [Oscillatoriaceae cyanobacterium Prado104]|jgi:ribosomal protein L37E|nr:zinc ribbon domain-containing protein [Oscillatoriaceae cyanobacterium Prado104]
MSNFIFVLDTKGRALSPCQPGVGRSLLKAAKASVFRQFPFTIILNKEVPANPELLELKLDSGSKTTGIAILQGVRAIFGVKYGKVTIAVSPQYTSQDCSNCGETVKKSLIVRTHVCPHCGFVAERDRNVAVNILQKGLSVGQTQTHTLGEFNPLASLEQSCGVTVG